MNLQFFAGSRRFAILLTFFVFCFSTAAFAPPARAQTENLDALEKQASQLLEQNKFTEALPVLEKLAAAKPDNANVQFFLGYCVLAQSIGNKDEAARRQLRVRARSIFVKAKELGRNDQLINSLIESIAPDGSDKAKFSENKQADALMEQGEVAFTQGKSDEALSLYQKALELDPKLYYAALFSGDVYRQKGDFANAEKWYQKAIAIDPNIETAYRYSATPLMKAGKIDEARDRYIEAFITNPFNRLAAGGLEQWAEVTQKTLAHPKIEIPANVGKGANGNMTITLGAGENDETDGSFAWTVYGISRAAWQLNENGKPSEAFKKAYPRETVYRHSLAEEFDALKTTVSILKERMKDKDSKIKILNPSLAKLVELHDKGLLEPYILLTRIDRGIFEDYMPYLRANRAKLRQYVLEYVIDGDKK
jgi:tetratricopeptide (TPR) repeat protein